MICDYIIQNATCMEAATWGRVTLNQIFIFRLLFRMAFSAAEHFNRNRAQTTDQVINQHEKLN